MRPEDIGFSLWKEDYQNCEGYANFLKSNKNKSFAVDKNTYDEIWEYWDKYESESRDYCSNLSS